MLEIGANITMHTVELSRLVGNTGAVHAFEPQRLVFQVLCANLALNNCMNLFTHQAAVGAANGTLRAAWLDPRRTANFGGSSLQDANDGETVPVLRVDELGIAACHLIKVDVEGMEAEVLRDARATIARFRPILDVENDRQEHYEALIALVQSYGSRRYWHTPPLYSDRNFRGDPENIFGTMVCVNMLCLPAELQQSLTALREIEGPADRWR